jgi:hypothetical protein
MSKYVTRDIRFNHSTDGSGALSFFEAPPLVILMRLKAIIYRMSRVRHVLRSKPLA